MNPQLPSGFGIDNFIFLFAVNDVRIHGIVCIVDTDIPGTYTMFGLLVGFS